MNCKNCGAPITDGYCEYCGTDYGGNHSRIKEVETKLKITKLQLAQALQTQYIVTKSTSTIINATTWKML